MNELLELIADVNSLLTKIDELDAEIVTLKSELSRIRNSGQQGQRSNRRHQGEDQEQV